MNHLCKRKTLSILSIGIAMFISSLWSGAATAVDQAEKNEAKPVTEESYFVRLPDDLMALTHSGELGSGYIPDDIARFTEEGAAGSAVFLFKLRDAEGEVVGYATQLEVVQAGTPVGVSDASWPTDWILVVAEKGTIFLHQIEKPTKLRDVALRPVVETGEPREGEVTAQTTIGPRSDGRGIIIGGTRGFDGIEGTFVEIDTLTAFSLENGLVGEIELRMFRTQ